MTSNLPKNPKPHIENGSLITTQELKIKLLEEFDTFWNDVLGCNGCGSDDLVCKRDYHFKEFLSSALSQMEEATLESKKGETKRTWYQKGYQDGVQEFKKTLLNTPLESLKKQKNE